MHHGAQDYLVKGQVDGGAILRSMRYAIERQRLEAARAELEPQRDEFFSSVSHDLRTPVAAIKAAIGVVLANEPSNMPAPLHRLLGNIDLAADELTRLIEDLLEIARLQAGRVSLRSTLDLRDVVTRATRAIEPLAAERQQTLLVRLPGGPVIADVDGERLGRVLRNLLANAQKYGRVGGRIVVGLEELADAGADLRRRQRSGHFARRPGAHLRALLPSRRLRRGQQPNPGSCTGSPARHS